MDALNEWKDVMMHLSYRLLFMLCLAPMSWAQDYVSPCDVVFSENRKIVHVLSATSHQLIDCDLDRNEIVSKLELPGAPTNITLAADGRGLIITGGGANGRIWKVDQGRISKEIKTGHTPMSPIVSPDGKWIYVCNRFDNDISIIDSATGTTRARIPVVREPIAIDLTPDGKWLYVANHLPEGRADVEYVAAAISVINTQTHDVKHIPLVNGAEGLRGLKVSPDGKKVFATHLVARFMVPTTQLEFGWVATNGVSVIDVASQNLDYTVLLDDLEKGFPNPWAIGFSADGETLIISSAGNHELSLIDLPALEKKIGEEKARYGETNIFKAHNNLSLLSGIRKRVKLEGVGPRSVDVSGGRIVVGHYFSDTIEVVDVLSGWTTEHKSISLGQPTAMTPERYGEILFNDGAVCFQNWLSCATCHPDARTDAMNWDLLNDGMGNPKNVKTMLLAHVTPPTTWLAVRENAEVSVRAGIRHIQFTTRPEADAVAIDTYLKSLKPVPSPYLVNGKLTEAALRGKEVFETTGCIKCHAGPYFTDMKPHYMGTTKGVDEGRAVDTPHLIEVWRTAPYLHDGRARTVKEVLTSNRHGAVSSRISELSEAQLNDLIEYVLSL